MTEDEAREKFEPLTPNIVRLYLFLGASSGYVALFLWFWS